MTNEKKNTEKTPGKHDIFFDGLAQNVNKRSRETANLCSLLDLLDLSNLQLTMIDLSAFILENSSWKITYYRPTSNLLACSRISARFVSLLMFFVFPSN